MVVRKRPIPLRVMLAASEKKALMEAANETGVALSVYVRMMALEALRRRDPKAA